MGKGCWVSRPGGGGAWSVSDAWADAHRPNSAGTSAHAALRADLRSRAIVVTSQGVDWDRSETLSSPMRTGPRFGPLRWLGLVPFGNLLFRVPEVTGVVFVDQNGNGVRDVGEPGLG